MDTLTDNSKSSFQPSLLRQIVDEVDAMNDEEQKDLLRKIKLNKLEAEIKALDKKLEKNELVFSEEEIASMVSEDRRNRYAEKAHS